MKNYYFHQFSNIFFLAVLLLIFSNCFKEDYGSHNSPSSEANIKADGTFLSNSGSGFGGGNFDPSGEGYNTFEENPWVEVTEEPVSTFSIDADGASYSNSRRFLQKYDQLPPKDAIRTEELVNFFAYDYQNPSNGDPIGLNGEICSNPWAPENKLLRIGIRGKDIPRASLPAANFVFLLDVSGSMKSVDKLELLKESFTLFTDHLRPFDRVAIVTYASSPGVKLESTPGSQKDKIKDAIAALGPGGSTAGADGIITAYKIALDNFIPGGNNRVILGTDGDFNVGPSSQQELVALIEEKRELGVFLTILGVGTGNLQDGMMEQIANNGNGNYEYIDHIEQGEKVFIEEFNKFYTVAKDVKIQINFNSSQVLAYRLIGYENRLLEEPDFTDDTKDAGEIGSNQTITALYELKMLYTGTENTAAIDVDFRYKLPDENTSHPISLNIYNNNTPFQMASESMRFAASVAGYGLLLRDSEHKGNLTYDKVYEWAKTATSYDPYGDRNEFLDLVLIAKDL